MVPGVTISRIAARRSIGSVPASRESNARPGPVLQHSEALISPGSG
jgi:hypothetical protein